MLLIVTKRRVVWSALGLLGIGLAGFGVWMLLLPQPTAAAEPPPVPAAEAAATIAALKPPKRDRPLIAIIGINDATETTDYVMPYGILRRADVADVLALATAPGPVELYPALTVVPDTTIADFDAQHPEGADFVIVPAMSRDDDPAVLEWLRRQSAKGSTIVGVCAGAKVVADAGLLDGRRATTHWYYLDEMLGRHPAIRYVPDRRIVVDAGVATTTGITASMPVSLTLIEAIAGREKADEVATTLGLPDWDAEHDSSAFRFTRPFATTVLVNTLSFWNRDTVGVELTPGIDEVSLAMVADAWSRTYRSRAVTFAGSAEPIATMSGMRVVPDEVGGWPADQRVAAFGDRPPAQALDEALDAIAARYGVRTAAVVSMQLEYPSRILRAPRRTASR
jgi:putative intracellular protease/amidase